MRNIWVLMPFLIVFIAVLSLIIIPWGAGAQLTPSTVTTTVAQSVPVVNETNYITKLNLPANFQLYVTSPANSTLSYSLIPVNYSLASIVLQQDYLNESQLVFTPVNGSQFLLHVLSIPSQSNASNFVFIQQYDSAAKVPLSSVKNVTGIGNISVTATITAHYFPPVSNWNLFFGLTGLKTNFSLTSLEWQVLFLGLAGSFIGIGYAKHSRIKSIGFIILVPFAIYYLGIIDILLVGGVYLLGLLIITLIWRTRKK